MAFSFFAFLSLSNPFVTPFLTKSTTPSTPSDFVDFVRAPLPLIGLTIAPGPCLSVICFLTISSADGPPEGFFLPTVFDAAGCLSYLTLPSTPPRSMRRSFSLSAPSSDTVFLTSLANLTAVFTPDLTPAANSLARFSGTLPLARCFLYAALVSLTAF